MRVIATAGHVDHGKSTLVQALTGTDPDRWAEEKERGLTIDLGFAFATLPSGEDIAFVDVPGHVRFLKNMLAGVGAVDACLFVVAATEGWKPQSEEHLRILQLLGVNHGVIALTKVAPVDAAEAQARTDEVRAHTEGTFLEGAPIVAVDAPAGRGLDSLRAALADLVRRTPAAVDDDRPRLWIDRVFAAKGAGTVVTGTLTGGALHVDDELWARPGRRTVRVRSLQSAHTRHEVLAPGARVAVNLTGIHHDQLARGQVLVRPGQWHETATVDASLSVLPSLDHAVSRRGAYVVYLGSGEHPVRMRVIGPDAIAAGGHGFVRLHLPVALPLLPGDHFVLRESGRSETIGGGEVLDVDPQLPAASATPDRSVDRVVRERGWVEVAELERLTGERRAPDVDPWVVDPKLLADERDRSLGDIADAGPAGVDLAGLDPRRRAVHEQLAAEGLIVLDRGRARSPGQPDPVPDHPYLAAIDATPFRPPSPAAFGIDAKQLADLRRRGLLFEHDGIYFTAGALDAAAVAIAGALETRPEGLSIGDLRELLDTTRKYVIPLMTILDATGRTRRRDDRRIAGPRLLPRSSAPE